MILQLLKFKFLQFRRSPTFHQSLIQNIILGIIGAYLIVNMVVVGFLFKEMVTTIYPEGNLLVVAIACLLYYAIADLVMRYFLQKFPVIDLKPYLTLPIKKGTIVNNLLIRSIGSIFNLLPLCFFLPFFFRSVVGQFPSGQVIGFFLLGIGIILFNNFLSFYIDKRMTLKGYAIGIILLLIMAIIFLDYQGYIPVFPFFEACGAYLLKFPFLCIIPLTLAGCMYLFSFRFFRDHLTLDTQVSSNHLFASAIPSGIFSRFGKAGTLMELEVKLILRSKRSRGYLVMSVLFLLYPLVMLDVLENSFMKVIICMVITGMIALNHGQLMLSWNSLHFDLIQSRIYTFTELFQAKYYLLAASCILLFMLSFPYFYLGTEFMLFNFVMLFYSMTVPIFLYMLLASLNSKRIDPNEKSAFNMSGMGAGHFLIMLPIMAIPCLLYWIGYSIGGKYVGLFIILFTGIIGLLFHRWVIQYCVSTFKSRRYDIGAAFRKSQ